VFADADIAAGNQERKGENDRNGREFQAGHLDASS
jgi:hypothetical protein